MGWFLLERRRLRDPTNMDKYLMGGVKMMEPDSSEWFPLIGLESPVKC